MINVKHQMLWLDYCKPKPPILRVFSMLVVKGVMVKEMSYAHQGKGRGNFQECCSYLPRYAFLPRARGVENPR
jgi:hypothetical protein